MLAQIRRCAPLAAGLGCGFPRRPMTAAFRIRRATPTDLPALLALERSAFTTDHLSPRQYRQHIDSPTAL